MNMVEVCTITRNNAESSYVDEPLTPVEDGVTKKIEQVITDFLLERKPRVIKLNPNDSGCPGPIKDLLMQMDLEIQANSATNKERGILVAGDFGQGKSSVVNWLVGENVSKVGSTMEAITTSLIEVQLQSQKGVIIRIFDTIGFDNTNFESIRMLNRVLLNEFRGKCNMVVFVRNIVDIRMDDTELDELKVYKHDFDLPVILVLNQASSNTKEKLLQQWKRNISHRNLTDILDTIVVLNSVNTDQNEVPDGIEDLQKKIWISIDRQPTPNIAPYSRIDQLDIRVRRDDALKFSKNALISVGLASTAALAIGLLPVPFVDWPLIVTAQVSMFTGICVAFKLKVNKGIFIWLTTVGLGSFGVGVGLLRMIANALKLIPGVNVPAMIIDGTFSFGGTFIMGLAFIATLRQLYIKGVDLSKMTEAEQKEKIKNLFLSEIKVKWTQWRSTSTKAVLREEIKLTDGVCTSSSADFDVDKFCEMQGNLLREGPREYRPT
jgi:ribosome biogenesis GTPase A/uncharacterized protein (DUF697 family)